MHDPLQLLWAGALLEMGAENPGAQDGDGADSHMHAEPGNGLQDWAGATSKEGQATHETHEQPQAHSALAGQEQALDHMVGAIMGHETLAGTGGDSDDSESTESSDSDRSSGSSSTSSTSDDSSGSSEESSDEEEDDDDVSSLLAPLPSAKRPRHHPVDPMAGLPYSQDASTTTVGAFLNFLEQEGYVEGANKQSIMDGFARSNGRATPSLDSSARPHGAGVRAAARRVPQQPRLKRRTVCQGPMCHKQAKFGPPGGPAKFCMMHRLEGEDAHVPAANYRCEQEGCIHQPCFGYFGKLGRFCGEHKLRDMVDIKNRRCRFQGCSKQPSYGYEGHQALYCNGHRHDDMVNVRTAKCMAEGCRKQPSYAPPGSKPQYCAGHSLAGMVDVVSRRCEAQGCTRVPSFGWEGENRRFCATHRLDGMINVSRKCAYKACKRQPVWGDIRDKLPKFCDTHRLDRMINLVRDGMCGYLDCNQQATFGFSGAKPRLCDDHRVHDMIPFPLGVN